jgi:hypothetical protein
MASIRIEIDRRGVRRAALYSPEVGTALHALAEQIATRARGNTSDDVKVETQRRKDRLGMTVSRENAAGEANDRALGRSIGGA